MTAPSNAKYNNDGYFIMGGGRNGGSTFVRNIFCCEAGNGGGYGKGKIHGIVDINPKTVKVTDEKGSIEKNISGYFDEFLGLNKIVRVLNGAYTCNSIWGNSGDSLRNAQHYFLRNSTNIKMWIKNISNKTINFTNGSNSGGNYYDNSTFNDINKLTINLKNNNGRVLNSTTSGKLNVQYNESSGKTIIGPVNITNITGSRLEIKDNNGRSWRYESINGKKYFTYQGNVSAKKITVRGVYDNATFARIYFVYINGVGQGRIIFKTWKASLEDKIEFDIEGTTPRKIKIKKEFLGINGNYNDVVFEIGITGNSNTIRLSGAEAKNVSENGGKYTVKPDRDGYITVSNITENITLSVNEIVTSKGFKVASATQSFDYDYKKNTLKQKYNISEFEINENSNDINLDNTKVIEIKVKNEEITPNKLIIQKIDLSGNPISNIEFTIKLSGVKSCSIKGRDYTDNGTGIIEAKATTDSSGQILIEKHSGKEAIEFYKLGDVDYDGNVEVGDARVILRTSVGLDEINENSSILDLNGDGVIMRWSSGI